MSAWGMPVSFSNASHNPSASPSSPQSPLYAAKSETAGKPWMTMLCHRTSSSSSGLQATRGSKPGMALAEYLIFSLYSWSWVAVKEAMVWMTRLPVFVTLAPAILLRCSLLLVPRRRPPQTSSSRSHTNWSRAVEVEGIGWPAQCTMRRCGECRVERRFLGEVWVRLAGDGLIVFSIVGVEWVLLVACV